MKKLFAILFAVMMVASMATVASAASTTTLTTTVPAATYTLNIPADQEIDYGATETNIGNVTLTKGENFAVGKNVEVTISFDGLFKSEETSTTIPYQLKIQANNANYYKHEPVLLKNNNTLTFKGLADTSIDEKATASFPYEFTGGSQTETHRDTFVDGMLLCVDSADWGKAMAGEYTATITFTAEVVVEE